MKLSIIGKTAIIVACCATFGSFAGAQVSATANPNGVGVSVDRPSVSVRTDPGYETRTTGRVNSEYGRERSEEVRTTRTVRSEHSRRGHRKHRRHHRHHSS